MSAMAKRKARKEKRAAKKKRKVAPVGGDGSRTFWPKGEPMPGSYRKMRREPMPCPKCRRVRLDDLGQAVLVTNSGCGLAWFRCRGCDHRWSLPVEETQ